MGEFKIYGDKKNKPVMKKKGKAPSTLPPTKGQDAAK